jgi:hypothetical protein
MSCILVVVLRCLPTCCRNIKGPERCNAGGWKVPTQIEQLLAADGSSMLAWHDLLPQELDGLKLPAGCRVVAVPDAEGAARVTSVFTLAVRDRPALRRVVSALPELGKADTIICLLTAAGGNPPLVLPRPEWPSVSSLIVDNDDPAWTAVQFVRPAPVRRVLAEFARCSAFQRWGPTGWPLLGVPRDNPDLWPSGDPASVVFMGEVSSSDTYGPPDVIVGDTQGLAAPNPRAAPHPVTGRNPVFVTTGPEQSWAQFADASPAELSAALARGGVISLGGVDDKIFNPIGFRRRHSGELPTLRPLDGRPEWLTFAHAGTTRSIDTRRGLAESDLSSLRHAKGLVVDWTGGSGPQAYCRLVASLSMAGVPVIATAPPEWARLLLGNNLIDALERRPSLGSPLSREEASIELRRAALVDHSAREWRRRLAHVAESQAPAKPSISVLLCTRRPDMLRFAIRQVCRQRYTEMELIVSAHGFEVSEPELAEMARPGVPVTAVTVSDRVAFGDALNAAAAKASGDVFVKMDDDDWYGPDFVSDLELARMYSGADIVGCPPEFIFLEDSWVTTRGKVPTELYRSPVAGGTLMVDRAAFRAVGGFRRLRKHVDASLQSAVVEAGGTVYRSHGLGYVLRRQRTGHTWDPGPEYFLSPARIARQWHGFRPSRLLEVDESDVPRRGSDGPRSDS